MTIEKVIIKLNETIADLLVITELQQKRIAELERRVDVLWNAK